MKNLTQLLTDPAIAAMSDTDALVALNAKTITRRQEYWLTYSKLTVDFGAAVARAVAALMTDLSADPLVVRFDRALTSPGVDLSLDATVAQINQIVEAVPAEHPKKAGLMAVLPTILAKGIWTESLVEQAFGRGELATLEDVQHARGIDARRREWAGIYNRGVAILDAASADPSIDELFAQAKV